MTLSRCLLARFAPLAALLLAASAHAEPTRSFSFSYADEALLGARGTKSSWLHLAGDANRDPLPLVVFLHGLNFVPQKHLWFGGGRADLRPTFERVARTVGPFLVAAPSQLKDSGAARTLWLDFDLPTFVEATALAAHAAGYRVDRARVFLVGHSGAGCSSETGLFVPMTRDDEIPSAILAIDTCQDEEIGRAAARTNRPVLFAWQDLEWPRDVLALARGFEEEAPPLSSFTLEKVTVYGTDAHNAIVPIAIEEILPRLLAPERARLRAVER